MWCVWSKVTRKFQTGNWLTDYLMYFFSSIHGLIQLINLLSIKQCVLFLSYVCTVLALFGMRGLLIYELWLFPDIFNCVPIGSNHLCPASSFRAAAKQQVWLKFYSLSAHHIGNITFNHINNISLCARNSCLGSIFSTSRSIFHPNWLV